MAEACQWPVVEWVQRLLLGETQTAALSLQPALQGISPKHTQGQTLWRINPRLPRLAPGNGMSPLWWDKEPELLRP